MVKLVRNLNDLTPRKRLLVGVVNTVIGIILIFVMNWSMGVDYQTSAIQVIVMLVLGMVVIVIYRRWEKSKSANLS